MAKDIDGTPGGAFAVLQDGAWHSSAELRDKCGQDGPKRARELREDKCGNFCVERMIRDSIKLHYPDDVVPEADASSHFYRIALSDISLKPIAAAHMRAHKLLKVSIPDAVDDVPPSELTVADLVFLLACMRNDVQLENPEVRKIWSPYRPSLEGKILRALPSNIQHPYDLLVGGDEVTLDDDEDDEG